MKIEKVKLVDLKPAERNVRMHPPEQINEYKRSLEKFGQTKAIVIDEKNNILIGNGLFIAISQLGWKEADCCRKIGLSENDKKKLMLADNRIFDLGSDDLNVFDQLIRELDGDFDIPGYTDDLLNSLVKFLSSIKIFSANCFKYWFFVLLIIARSSLNIPSISFFVLGI